MILIDTHVALWIVTDSSRFGAASRTIADQAASDGTLAISAVSFWEIALLIAKQHFVSTKNAGEIRAGLLSSGIRELSLTGDICVDAVELKSLHGDPADRFIMATAIAHHATLMTADKALLRWRHAVKRQNAEK